MQGAGGGSYAGVECRGVDGSGPSPGWPCSGPRLWPRADATPEDRARASRPNRPAANRRSSATDAVIVDVGQGAVDLSGDEVKPRISSIAPALAPVRHGAVPWRAVDVGRSPTWLAWREQMAQKPSNEKVQVLITMDGVPYEWQRIRSAANDLEHEAHRRAARAVVRGHFAGRRPPRGPRRAADVAELWITTSVEATVNAGDVAAIAAWPGVSEVMNATATERHQAEYTDAYSGLEARTGMRTTAFINAGMRRLGWKSGGPVRRAARAPYDFVDGSDALDWQHRGFIYCNTSGCFYRTSVDTCANGACSLLSPPSDNNSGAPTHANLVMQVMGGSIESGSDGSVTDPTKRIRRSGMAPRTDLYRYSTTDGLCSTTLAALQKAITDKVDVLDFSATMDIGLRALRLQVQLLLFQQRARQPAHLGHALGHRDGESGRPGRKQHLQRRLPLRAARRAHRGRARHRGAIHGLRHVDHPRRQHARRGRLERLRRRGRVPGDVGRRPRRPRMLDVPVLHAALERVRAQPAGHGQLRMRHVVRGAGRGGRRRASQGGAHRPELEHGRRRRAPLVDYTSMGDGYSYYGYRFGQPTGFDPRSGANRVHMHYPSSANLTAPWGWGPTVVLSNRRQGLVHGQIVGRREPPASPGGRWP